MMPQQPMVGGVRVNMAVTGGELFGKLFVGFLLCIFTAWIYLPWFIVSLARYLLSKATIGPTQRGNVRLAFHGTGGQLFLLFLVHGFLTMITFGLYRAWFMCKQIQFFADNTRGQMDDGTQVQLRFDGRGGEFFVPMLVGTILTLLTLGIYFPWFLCNMQRLVYSRMKILENGTPVGSFEFTGQGGKLLGTYIVGVLLTVITAQIYRSWFKCKLYKFRASNTRIDYHGHRWVGDFTGKGLDLFLITLVGALLLPLTLGIYFFWFLAKQLRFQYNNLVFHQMS